MRSLITSIGKTITWEKIFIALVALFILLMPTLSLCHGIGINEAASILYGNDIYNYFFSGTTNALEYNNLQYPTNPSLEYSSGLYDFLIVFLNKTAFSFIDKVAFRHIFISLIGVLLFIYTGLLAKLLSNNWRTAVIAFIFIVISPRIFSDSMTNSEDIPFAFGLVFYLYYFIQYTQSLATNPPKLKAILLLGLGFGLALGVRIEAVLLIPFSFLIILSKFLSDLIFRKNNSLSFLKFLLNITLHFAGIFIVGYLIALIFWPWLQQSPINNFIIALKSISLQNHPIKLLFEGSYITNSDTPQFYTLKWIFISNPILIILLSILSILGRRILSKRYGKRILILISILFLLPLGSYLFFNINTLESWHHYFYIYPFATVLSALTANYLIEKTSLSKVLQYIYISLLIIGVCLPFSWIIKSFPNEYLYFNEIAGGIQKANGVYDLDYNQNTTKQATEWLIENTVVKKDKIILASVDKNVSDYLKDDTTNFQGVYVRNNIRDTKDWDYYIANTRSISIAQYKNNSWPPQNAIHTIFVDGTPICAVLERKTKLDMAANGAMERQHLDTAYALYQQAVEKDASNDGVLVKYAAISAQRGEVQKALELLDNAIKIDADNPAIYNLQMQIFRAMKDNNRAQQAENKLRTLMN